MADQQAPSSLTHLLRSLRRVRSQFNQEIERSRAAPSSSDDETASQECWQSYYTLAEQAGRATWKLIVEHDWTLPNLPGKFREWYADEDEVAGVSIEHFERWWIAFLGWMSRESLIATTEEATRHAVYWYLEIPFEHMEQPEENAYFYDMPLPSPNHLPDIWPNICDSSIQAIDYLLALVDDDTLAVGSDAMTSDEDAAMAGAGSWRALLGELRTLIITYGRESAIQYPRSVVEGKPDAEGCVQTYHVTGPAEEELRQKVKLTRQAMEAAGMGDSKREDWDKPLQRAYAEVAALEGHLEDQAQKQERKFGRYRPGNGLQLVRSPNEYGTVFQDALDAAVHEKGAGGEADATPTEDAPVVLKGLGEPCYVCGKRKDPLTEPQYEVIAKLLTAPEGLHKADLIKVKPDALGCLKRLRRDSDWKAVIQMAGVAGGVYHIRIPE